ncbi:unnamed protein product [Moneuplotes crassus]|uniref:Uncharacterized protein n=1 Tax=Euplotes crassus TaxID=5936 RepID=A0AAD1XS13_EUPCR|nr:unnamed protein product [Moneuplotes crassus]
MSERTREFDSQDYSARRFWGNRQEINQENVRTHPPMIIASQNYVPRYDMYCLQPPSQYYGMYQEPINWAFQRWNPRNYSHMVCKFEVAGISEFIKIQQQRDSQLAQNNFTQNDFARTLPAPYWKSESAPKYTPKARYIDHKETIERVGANNIKVPSLRPLLQLTKDLNVENKETETNQIEEDPINTHKGDMGPKFEKVSQDDASSVDKDKNETPLVSDNPDIVREEKQEVKLHGKKSRFQEEVKELSKKYQDEDLQDQLQIEVSQPSKKNYKGIRWGRAEDKKLFALIRTLQAEGKIGINDILAMNPNREAYTNQGIRILARRFGWKSLMKNLVQRIQSLYKKDFSVREIKTLKQIVKKEYEYKNLDYDKIIYHFPGKTTERLREICEQIVECRHSKNLSNFRLDM